MAAQGYLGRMLEAMAAERPELELTLKTFINRDLTVDGEVRISHLPEEWREEGGAILIGEFLSRILRTMGELVPGAEGGVYWISIGVRFGPQSEAEPGAEDIKEIYKRYRGLFQVAVHPTNASYPDGIQNNVAGIVDIIKKISVRRSMPPSAILVRFTWTPDGTRPERYEGERGTGKKS